MPAEWSDYRYFLAIARAGSLSAAARSLRVDQSTVGRRLAALEEAVGARLFDRTPEGYVLTAAGDAVRGDVESLETGFLGVERRLAGGDARIEGVVRVATSETFATTFLIAHLGGLRVRHPGLSIDLATGNQPVDLARREADLAVRLGTGPKQPNLVTRQIGEVGFALYGAPSYLARRGQPRLRGGLRGHEIVTYGVELAAIPGARWLMEHAGKADIAFRAVSVGSVCRAVEAGLGLGVLPSFIGARTLQRFGPPVLGTSPVWTVVHEDLQRNARVRAVLLFLADLMAQEKRALLYG